MICSIELSAKVCSYNINMLVLHLLVINFQAYTKKWKQMPEEYISKTTTMYSVKTLTKLFYCLSVPWMYLNADTEQDNTF